VCCQARHEYAAGIPEKGGDTCCKVRQRVGKINSRKEVGRYIVVSQREKRKKSWMAKAKIETGSKTIVGF